MVNLEGYKDEKFTGTITKVEEMTLREHLKDEDRIRKFKKGMTKFPSNVKSEDEKELYREQRMNSNVLVITYQIEVNEEITESNEFFNIPKATGWGRSNLKTLVEKNDLPYDTSKWVGLQLKVSINKEGYLKLLD
jgi:hypothetical protein